MKFFELILKYKKIILASALCFLVLALIDTVLAVGAAFIAFLTAITFLILKKIGFKTKTIYILFLIILLIYLGAVLFFYYAHFQPFSGGGGDSSEYHIQAKELADKIHRGDFSLKGLDISIFTYYTVILSYVYVLTLPKELIGQMFNAWSIALAASFVYLIVLEMGGSKKQGFLSGLIIGIYPSLIFFGSSLGKDALVALLSLVSLFLILKLTKIFSWKRFLVFYIVLAALINFRVYIGYAALLTFIICWFLFSKTDFKRRFIYGLAMIVILGFLPQVSGGHGYYGINFVKMYLNPKMITYYREKISIPNPKISSYTGFPVYDEPSAPEASASQTAESAPLSAIESSTPDSSASEIPASTVPKRGRGSAITVETGFENPFTFLKNSLISFIFTSLGPFPWQLRFLRHLLVLPETVLWYLVLFFAVKGIKKPDRASVFVLLIFSFIVLGGLSLFISNYGIMTRIRIPAFIAVFCLAPFGINWASGNKIIKFFSKKLDLLTT